MNSQTILGLDPGRDKCGVAIMLGKDKLLEHQVIDSDRAIAHLKQLAQKYAVDLIIMGNGTTSKSWQKQLEFDLPTTPIITVDEKNSTLEARDRYWMMYPPRRFQRILPQGLRTPPRPVDDIVAIILIERYLNLNQ